MKIKAVFMDLDGTLLRNNHTISEKIKKKKKSKYLFLPEEVLSQQFLLSGNWR